MQCQSCKGTWCGASAHVSTAKAGNESGSSIVTSTMTGISAGTSTMTSTMTSITTSITPSTMTSTMTSTTTPKASCPACERKKESMVADVVIPFYERDLCKVGYTAKSLEVHDPEHRLGRIFLMWVSKHSTDEYLQQITEATRPLVEARNATVIDFSPQVNSQQLGGWYAQQVLKLKIASLVTSEYYIVLDSKNTLIRDIKANMFFDDCGAAKIFGDMPWDGIPPPHSDWYAASARALGLSPPSEGYWPTSITPMVIHRQTVLDMLASINENESTDSLCNGPLCDMMGARSITGQGSTEFTMYILWARSRVNFPCLHAMETPIHKDLSKGWAISLWRGEGNRQSNLDNSRTIASGKEVPVMFGSQASALDGMSPKQRNLAIEEIAEIYQDAGLHNASNLPTDYIEKCIIGGSWVPAAGDPVGPDPSRHVVAIEGDFCCASGAYSGDACGSCQAEARQGPSNWCGRSRANCDACRQTWCEKAAPKVANNGTGSVMRHACAASSCDYLPLGGCQCDEACVERGDCCSDFVEKCDQPTLVVMKKLFHEQQGPLRQARWQQARKPTAVLVLALPAAIAAFTAFTALWRRARPAPALGIPDARLLGLYTPVEGPLRAAMGDEEEALVMTA